MLDLFVCCRLCLKHDETVTVNCIEINELCKAVEQVFGFKITYNDKCSTRLCRDCVHKVTTFAMYRDTVLSNQKSLEQYIILNAKLTGNSEVKDDDNDVILLESNDEKSLDSPKISDHKGNHKLNSAPSEDDIPLMKLVAHQKKSLRKNADTEKNQVDVTNRNHKTTFRSRHVRKKTLSNSKHFKNAVVKIRRLNETELRRLSKSYNQQKIQEEEKNINQSELVTPFRKTSSPNLVKSKTNCKSESGTIVAKLLSAVSKQENTLNRSKVDNRDITRTKSMDEMKTVKHSSVKMVQIPIQDKITQDQPQIQSSNNDSSSRLTEETDVNSYVSNLITQYIKITKAASETNLTNKDTKKSVNNSNVKISNNEISNTNQNQTALNADTKAIESSTDAKTGRRNDLVPVCKKIRRILPKHPSEGSPTPDKNNLTIQNDNKQPANAISNILPSAITNDKSSNGIKIIDLTDSTLVNINASSSSSSNQHSISPLNLIQSTNNSVGFCEKTPYQTNYLLDHTYNIVRSQVPQTNISPLCQYSVYSVPQVSNIESNERIKTIQLPIQQKPTNSAQISTISNKTTATDKQIGNNPSIAPQNRQISLPKCSDLQFKEIKPKPPTAVQISTVPNKTVIARAQTVSVCNPTHLPQNQDRRVKVLTVNELNMRAAEYSQYESISRKLPIRITLVKIQNEVQIKLTDSNNKDINFYDLTSAEQSAVKSSLIEPSCKQQILSAIKNCSPDQYSANMLRCVGFTLKEIS